MERKSNDKLTPGWRARIGLIYMHSSIVMEPEFYRMAPSGVTIHTTRIVLPTVDKKGLTCLGESEKIEECTDLLCSAPISCVIFGGTSASFIKGLGWDNQIIERMKAYSHGIPATTTSTASVNALKALGARKIVIATPYIDEVNKQAQIFFNDNGFEVIDLKGLQIQKDHDIGFTTLDSVCNLVKSTRWQEADAIFISCTNFQTVEIIEELEKDLGKPVVSAIQASFWECLNLAGVNTQDVIGYGTLFKNKYKT
jgi:maleate isomerase